MTVHSRLSPVQQAARNYALRGWHVFPLKAGTKGRDGLGRSSQLLANGQKDASCDPDVIRAWWDRWPDANIGLHLTASGLVAVDPDLYKPDCKWHAFIKGRDLPDTLVQSSPRGGKHYIFRAAPDASYAAKLCDGVDIKHNGYILLEPSTFEGGVYRFETDRDPVPAPDWLPGKGDICAGTTANIPEIASTKPIFGINTHGTATTGEVEGLLGWINLDAGGYDAWIEILQALHDHFKACDEGLAFAEAWSQQGAKFKGGEVAAKWRGFAVGGGVTRATIAHRAS